MCGIAGMVDWRAASSADLLRSIGEEMVETLRHRGPDGGGVRVEAEGGVVLGQRRLAIIDLSPSGAQPMHSADRRYVITFNGEVYNYRDIRRELQAVGRSMRSDSDTVREAGLSKPQTFCQAGPDCGTKWAKANAWVTENSGLRYKVNQMRRSKRNNLHKMTAAR
jgi:glutamate synthase domain-containing protein 1